MEQYPLKQALLPFFVLLPVLVASAQESKLPMVAVLPFTSRVLDSSAIDGLTSAMNSELINTGKFRVMERSQMDGILKEQGFQQSGACDGSECAVEVGKLLSVDQMVLGTIAKVGNTYSLSARLVNVQTGEVIKSLTKNSRAEVDAILTDIIPVVARDLAGAGKTDTLTVVPTVAAVPEVVQPASTVSSTATTVPEAKGRTAPAPRSESSHWGWWLAGGTVVAAGGVATAIVLMSGNSTASPSTTTVHASW